MLLQTSHTMIKEIKKCFSIVNNDIGEVTEDDNREYQTLLKAVDVFSITTSILANYIGFATSVRGRKNFPSYLTQVDANISFTLTL